MRRLLVTLTPATAALLVVFTVASVPGCEGDAGSRSTAPTNVVPAGHAPAIRPDYAGVTLPPNIAPLRFLVAEPGVTAVRATLSAEGAEPLVVASDDARVLIPMDPWRQLLEAARGKDLRVDVAARGTDGQWRQYDPITNHVAEEAVDNHLVYRKIKPLYNFWGPVGIYQRDLEGWKESTLLFNEDVDGTQRTCANCHTFCGNRPDMMMLHVRGPGGGMLLRDGKLRKIDTRTKRNPAPGAFASWHPSGRPLAFSIDQVKQSFHTARAEVRDAYDLKSDLAVYDLDEMGLRSPPVLHRSDQLETFPAWSADGRYLYFSLAPRLWGDNTPRPPVHFRDVRYSIMRIAYDIRTGKWGQIETVLDAADYERSITQAKLSPDGRWLLCCMSPYSMQPSFQPKADLYLLDLRHSEAGARPLECNSRWSESWHSWSSNSRWIAFTSKRGTGQFGRLYLAHIDADGHASKAFVMPQEDPAFYDGDIMCYQLPELVTGEVPLTEPQVIAALHKNEGEKSDVLTGATRVAGDQGGNGRQ